MIAETQNSPIARDLQLNLKRIVEDGSLTKEEGCLAKLATATAVGHRQLVSQAREELKVLGFTAEQIQEATEAAAIMMMLNTYYRFRHMASKETDYGPARLRMLALSNPVLGKARFEMLAFAISIINGCEACIRAHESTLRKEGIETEKLHDLARMASVVKGLQTLESRGN